VYSPLIERALAVCMTAHAGQTRKADTTVPYAVHPVHMALELVKLGVDEDVVVAALLHDVPEDCQGWTVERVRLEFGARVAGIVAQLTEDKRMSWEDRKRDGIAKVPHLSPDAATVKAIDQLHNLNSLRRQLETARSQERVWSRFKGGRERTLEVARALAEALSARIDPRLARTLLAGVDALEAAAARPEPERAPR
jgi:(p)ppGpp synthase/HD superfamily hydrolase